MQELTAEGRRIVNNLASKHSVSPEAVLVLLRALIAGNGSQAQFDHPDLGGMGQWSRGGMIMVGDMFNQGLKYKVSALCDELSGLLSNQPLVTPAASQSQMQSQGGGAGVSFFVSAAQSNAWWPAELGAPSSTGAQNDLLYAYFPATRRLAIRQGGATRVYDTGDHSIGGFSQQQSGDQSLTFTSQLGLVRVADLPLVSSAAPQVAPTPHPAPASAASAAPSTPASVSPAPPRSSAPPGASATPVAGIAGAGGEDIFATIEKLADLRQKNILTEEEFAAKKAELLSRL